VSKTDDIEWEIRRALQDGPLTLAMLEGRLPAMTVTIDRRWFAVALHQMLGDGRIRTTGCDDQHSHDGACVVEAT
jgi:hypothetical protein